MTRQFATTATSIWDDEDWWELTGEQQRVYLMLTQQKDITPAGTLPLTLGRWANSTKGCTIDALSQTLRELSDAQYIVIDWRRELILIRSFVRWDRGYNNAKRLSAIQASAKAVGPKLLAGVLAHELNRLSIKHEIKAEPIDVKAMPHRSPIDAPSIDAGYGYVSNYLPEPEPEPEPEPGTGNQQSEGDRSPITATPQRAQYPAEFKEFWSFYPRKVGKDKALTAWRSAIKNRTTADEITDAARRMSQDPHLPEENFIPHATTWLNRGGWNDPPYPPRTNGRMPTADAHVMDALNLAQRLAAEEAQQDSTQARPEIEA